MEVEDAHQEIDTARDIHNEEPSSMNEKEAIEKLKNADWSPTAGSKQNESDDDPNYSMEGRRHRNIVHQKKGDIVSTAQGRQHRSITQKNQKRNTQK